MLSYQHSYHAGNFADVVKHLTLSLIINYLTQKDKPLFYLDTHAGRGQYDLKQTQAQKTKEYLSGIVPLLAEKASLPEVFSAYIDTITAFNPDNKLSVYPGSVMIARHLLRNIDRLMACELHPTEFQVLKTCRKMGKKLTFQEIDGIQALKSALPPLEKRGLVMIDPSYELKEEYYTIPKALEEAIKRFETGVYCLWYPIIDKFHHIKLQGHMEALKAPNKLHLVYHHEPINHQKMTGTGLWIINPPFVLKQQLEQAMPIICERLNPGIASYEISL